MMIRNSMKKMLSVIGVFVLIAAMALNFTGCGSNDAPETTVAQTEASTLTKFNFVVTDLDGNEMPFEISTNKVTVGEALLEEGLISEEYYWQINTKMKAKYRPVSDGLISENELICALKRA